MKKKYIASLVAIVFFVSGAVFAPKTMATKQNNNGKVPGQYIVVFQEGSSDAVRDAVVSRAGGEKIKNLNLINGRVVRADQAAKEKLKSDPAVLRVDEDLVVEALGKVDALGKTAPVPPAQTMLWGISQINADDVWLLGNTADPVKVGIIDTGISNTHPDLKANVKDGVNTINPLKNWNDDNGHGSHVAGIVAGIDNTIGVVGVAPKADLYAIKALNSKGSGYLSDIIEGLGWAIANKMQVVNMSLGSASGNESFHAAVANAADAGITIVAAAGNSGGAVSYPAAYSEVIAVSATDSDNKLAYFSSYGPEVDLAAPGVSVYSTYKGTGYATMSGTSMAAPHVAGVAALVINNLACAHDGNKCDPSVVKDKLQNSASDLGISGFDNLFGYGLVDAFQAVQTP